MKKRVISLLLVLAVVMCSLSAVYASDVNAVESNATPPVSPCAYDSFTVTIPAGEIMTASSSFSMEKDEIITINATYTPTNASVDFGLIAPDGLFYSSRGENGHIQLNLSITTRGKYTLAIRNNSSYEVSATGYVTY